METVLLVVHLMIVVALVGVVLVQRSEGGALGIGGGGNFLASRGQANVLTRTTTYLAIAFFATSIGLTIIAQVSGAGSSILDGVPAEAIPETVERPTNLGDRLRELGGAAPAAEAPAPAATPAPAVTPAAPEATPAPAAEAPAAAPAGDVPAAAFTPAPAATPEPAPAAPAADPAAPAAAPVPAAP